MNGSDRSAIWEALASKHESLFADRVMDEAAWVRHRTAARRHRPQPGKLASVMLGYWSVLLCVALLGVAVGVYNTTLVPLLHWPMARLEAVQAIFGAVTFALTLLLVFKTNSSYARWWEARKDVGQLVSLAHNLARQGVAYFPADQAHLVAALCRWTAAAMWVTKALVRADADLAAELAGLLLPGELDWLLAAPHKQLALGQALSSIVAEARVDPMVRMALDDNVRLYTFEFGACGRIFNTAIPFCYTRHTSRFLTAYLALLPLLLWPMAGWASPALAVAIAFLLLGVENIGAFLEEPFHVIAFDTFCVAVQRDIANIQRMHGAAGAPVVDGLAPPAAGPPAQPDSAGGGEAGRRASLQEAQARDTRRSLQLSVAPDGGASLAGSAACLLSVEQLVAAQDAQQQQQQPPWHQRWS
ncbi:hypothetical protein HT031_006208 [Scenedesmus sp. PABB004]|nr:hypothetical protein HT031_006208 [Scenedesmus sp. PABB004]